MVGWRAQTSKWSWKFLYIERNQHDPRTRTHWKHYKSNLVRAYLRIPQRSQEAGGFCRVSCQCNPTPAKWMKMDGWTMCSNRELPIHLLYLTLQVPIKVHRALFWPHLDTLHLSCTSLASINLGIYNKWFIILNYVVVTAFENIVLCFYWKSFILYNLLVWKCHRANLKKRDHNLIEVDRDWTS